VVQTAVNADTLAQALSGHDTGLGIHQLVLQGRGAGIDNQNVHWNLPPKNYVSFSWHLWYDNHTDHIIFHIYQILNP
jgi:hypothetical protein